MAGSRLSIAHFHWGFPPTIGGVETHMSILLPELIKRGHSQWVMTAALPDLPDKERYKGIHVYRTPVMDLDRLLQFQSDITTEKVEKEFCRFLDKAKPDIIHAHNMHYFTRIHASVMKKEAKKRKIPLILTAHNVWDEKIFIDLTARFPWDHVIAVSHYIKKEIAGVGFDENKVTVVHHGIDTELFAQRKDRAALYRKYPMFRGKRVVFHPARISLGKGAQTSVKAIKMVKRLFPDVMLVLAGASHIIDWDEHMAGDMEFLSDLVKILKLQDNIHIDSFTIDQMAEVYNLSELCIYPSSAQEPFGLTMLEAQASERPIVVTRAGGMPEIIQDGINGYVIPLRDHETLAHRIILLMEDSGLRKRLGKIGRTNVLTHFTKEIMVQAMLSVYQEVLDKKRH